MGGAAEHDLGALAALEAEAIGAPGQRSFRLRLLADGVAASLWLEKEQVGALAAAIQQVLAQHRKGAERRRPAAPGLGEFPPQATYDFQVSRLALAYDGEGDVLAVYATAVEAEDQGRPTLRATFTRELARRFSVQAEETITAGRPLCPLCKAPVEEEGHLCPPGNGHSTDALAWLGPPDL